MLEKTVAATEEEVVPGPRDDASSGNDEVEQELENYGRYRAGRDDLIRRADANGLSEARIARLMGHSRNTIRKALGRA
ncbi:DUF6003 family protein [Streptomyces sp. NPDC059340]|uniref:DUF6003 family protein n=1 Tax=Streptomyces sp. NPDC059340 TaxID=3346806 RepID=UPI00367F8492